MEKQLNTSMIHLQSSEKHTSLGKKMTMKTEARSIVEFIRMKY